MRACHVGRSGARGCPGAGHRTQRLNSVTRIASWRACASFITSACAGWSTFAGRSVPEHLDHLIAATPGKTGQVAHSPLARRGGGGAAGVDGGALCQLNLPENRAPKLSICAGPVLSKTDICSTGTWPHGKTSYPERPTAIGSARPIDRRSVAAAAHQHCMRITIPDVLATSYSGRRIIPAGTARRKRSARHCTRRHGARCCWCRRSRRRSPGICPNLMGRAALWVRVCPHLIVRFATFSLSRREG